MSRTTKSEAAIRAYDRANAEALKEYDAAMNANGRGNYNFVMTRLGQALEAKMAEARRVFALAV